MEAYLRAFVNWDQNDWARLLPMVEFADNNTKNASTNHTLFELNYNYYSWISFKDDNYSCSKSRSSNELIKKLRKLIDICQQIYSLLKNSRMEQMTKTWNSKTILQKRKFFKMVNILRQSKIEISKPNSLALSKFYIQLKNKPTN